MSNIRACLDRFEENIVVMKIDKFPGSIYMDRTKLPEGAKEGDWLLLEMGRSSRPTNIKIDKEFADDVNKEQKIS